MFFRGDENAEIFCCVFGQQHVYDECAGQVRVRFATRCCERSFAIQFKHIRPEKK